MILLKQIKASVSNIRVIRAGELGPHCMEICQFQVKLKRKIKIKRLSPVVADTRGEAREAQAPPPSKRQCL